MNFELLSHKSLEPTIAYQFQSRMHVFNFLGYEAAQLEKTVFTGSCNFFLTFRTFQFTSETTAEKLIND